MAQGRGLVLTLLVACGAGVALAPVSSALLGVLLAPSILALVLDRAPGRPVGRAVMLCGSALCVGPLTMLWRMDGGAGLAILGDPGVIVPAWAACAGGWLLTQLLPIGMRQVLEALNRSRVARLRAERERLSQVWGLDGQ